MENEDYGNQVEKMAEVQTERLLAYYSQLRKRQKISQSELKRITGLSRTAINRCENGKLMPTIRSMNKLLAPLGYQLGIIPLNELDRNGHDEEMEEHSESTQIITMEPEESSDH